MPSHLEAALKRFATEVETPEHDLDEVDLDGELEGVTELDDADMKALSKCPNITSLSLAENSLKKIHANFPALHKLASLDLRNNDLSSDVLGTVSRLDHLEVLMLTDNAIKTLDKFANLKPLSKLQYIGLEGCPVTETIPDYREKLFALLPQVGVIDFIDRDGNQLERPADETDEEDADLDAFYNKDYSDDESEDDDDFDPEGESEDDDDDEEDEEVEEVKSPASKKAKHE